MKEEKKAIDEFKEKIKPLIKDSEQKTNEKIHTIWYRRHAGDENPEVSSEIRG